MSKHPDLIAIGQRIRQLRIERGHSQEGFAYDTGIARGYYGGVERGERNISAINLIRIARALHVPVSELFVLIDKKRRGKS